MDVSGIPDHQRKILERFVDADLSIIKSVLYFDGWASYEEDGGALIFIGIDDSLQVVNYGYSVMAEDNTNYFQPRDISPEEAGRLIAELQECSKLYDAG
jgi:hypothetical protein